MGGSVGGMASDSESLSPAHANPALASSSAPAAVAHQPAAAAVGASSGSGVGAPSDAGGGRAAPAAALSGAGGEAPAERPTLAAIQRTYPKLSLASCLVLEQLVKDGQWPEVAEQVRRSEDFRAQQPGATMSRFLVSCSPTGSTLLDDIISVVLELLVEFQVPHRRDAVLMSCTWECARPAAGQNRTSPTSRTKCSFSSAQRMSPRAPASTALCRSFISVSPKSLTLPIFRR